MTFAKINKSNQLVFPILYHHLQIFLHYYVV